MKRHGVAFTALVAFVSMVLLPKMAHAMVYQKIFLGLTNMAVIIEPIGQDLVRRGVTVEKLKTDIQARIKTAGLQVTDDVNAPYICVSVGSLQIDDKKWVFSIDVAMRETVQLSRDATRSVFATTWRTGGVVMHDADDMAKVRDDVLKYVDEFVSDFKATRHKVAPSHGMPKKP